MKLITLVAVLMLSLTCGTAREVSAAEPAPASQMAKMARTSLVVTGAGHKPSKMTVEVAETLDQKIYGLMNRTSLDEDTGMLFPFDDNAERHFWMKNTLIPLDIIFVDDKGLIINIHENARPEDLTTITSEKPARAVLEIAGGRAAKKHIKAGDEIHGSFFGNTLAQ